MKRVLCYGDSNTWGYIPGSGSRFGPAMRWTGILQVKMGDDVCILEQGLNGRTTACEDPSHPGRNGAETLPSLLEQHKSLDLVTVMLGTNDMKHVFERTAADIAHGLETLVSIIQASSSGPLCTAPEVLLVSPPRIRLLPFVSQAMFRGAPEKSKELPSHYSVVAKRCRCHFLNATKIAAASFIDGVHMDRRGHRLLSEALARKLVLLFNQNMSMNRDL